MTEKIKVRVYYTTFFGGVFALWTSKGGDKDDFENNEKFKKVKEFTVEI